MTVSGGTLLYSCSLNQVLAGVVSGVGQLQNTGSNVLSLSAANTYTGNTTIGSGTLVVAGGGRLGNGASAGAIANAGRLVYSGNADQLLSGQIDVSGGSLSLADLSDTATYILDLTTLTGSTGTILGPIANLVEESGYNFRIADSVSLLLPEAFSSFSTGAGIYQLGTDITSLFTLDTTRWANPVPPLSSAFVQVASTGSSVDIVFVVVPEPATLGLLGFAGLAAAARRRKARRVAAQRPV